MRTQLCAGLAAVILLGQWSQMDVHAQDTRAESKTDSVAAGTFDGLKVRSIGPALMSGRIGDFAVNPKDRSHYFVAVCSGGVWKTTNAGTIYEPVFDGHTISSALL